MACLWWLGTRVPWGWPDDFKGWKGSDDGKFPELRSGFYRGARLKEPSISDNIKQRKNLGEGRDSHQMAARLLKVSEFLRSKLHLLAEVYAAEEWSSNPMTEPIVQVGNGKFGAVQSSINSVNLGLVHLQHSFYFYVVSNAWWDKVGSMDGWPFYWNYVLWIAYAWHAHWNASPSIPIAVAVVGQDEHNRLGADGDICLPFEMSPVGYSDALQQSSD